jgi:hypothetical protein
MFVDHSSLLMHNPPQKNYGIAVTDVDGDGAFEIVVAGFGPPNLVLKWDGEHYVDVGTERLADRTRQAIGVAAADVDGDGREEIYILNTDTFGGAKQVGDRLFDHSGSRWVDCFELTQNLPAANLIAGRSVGCIDRNGDGRYGFFVATYGGPMKLYELDDSNTLIDVSQEAGVDLQTGGRGVLPLPLISARTDVYVSNEGGANYLFVNRGDGTFEELGQQYGVADMYEHGRGVATLDANGDGLLDLVVGNWQGPHRLFVRRSDGIFVDAAPQEMAAPTQARTVIAADFDNDGYEEIFFNNMAQPNRLFARREGDWVQAPIGHARESDGLGTGAAVGDFDGDGLLELIIAHGETANEPLSLYKVVVEEVLANNWLRILPLTQYGAPARGALVTLTAGGRKQVRAVDAGSGYLCQMEPVAHFGLGAADNVDQVEINWPGGATTRLDSPAINTLHDVPYPAD